MRSDEVFFHEITELIAFFLKSDGEAGFIHLLWVLAHNLHLVRELVDTVKL